jgi:hypothetical protein
LVADDVVGYWYLLTYFDLVGRWYAINYTSSDNLHILYYDFSCLPRWGSKSILLCRHCGRTSQCEEQSQVIISSSIVSNEILLFIHIHVLSVHFADVKSGLNSFNIWFVIYCVTLVVQYSWAKLINCIPCMIYIVFTWLRCHYTTSALHPSIWKFGTWFHLMKNGNLACWSPWSTK